MILVSISASFKRDIHGLTHKMLLFLQRGKRQPMKPNILNYKTYQVCIDKIAI